MNEVLTALGWNEIGRNSPEHAKTAGSKFYYKMTPNRGINPPLLEWLLGWELSDIPKRLGRNNWFAGYSDDIYNDIIIPFLMKRMELGI